MEVTASLKINWANETLTVRADRTAWWEAQETLIFTDPHFGKAGTFRAAGIPLPRGTLDQDLKRLSNAIEETAPRRIIILGDFFHHRSGQTDETMDRICAWRERHSSIDFDLVMGNHDVRSASVPSEWCITVHSSSLAVAPFLFVHKPDEIKRLGTGASTGLFSMAGHVHPGVRLRGTFGMGKTCPCFWFGDRTALLPAFSLFTGTYQIRPRPQDQVVAIADGKVISLGNDR